MTCPDLDQLIDLYHGVGDPELKGHVGKCPSCQADLAAILLFPIACGSEVDVPEGLVAQVLTNLGTDEHEQERTRETFSQRLVAGLIGLITAAAALLAAGSSPEGGPMLILLFSFGVGVASGIVRPSSGFWGDKSGIE